MECAQRIVAIAVVSWLALIPLRAAGQAPSSAEKPLVPANATALEGVPSVRLDATEEGAKRRRLQGAEASEHRLRVAIVNGQYYWASRENRPLTLTTSGEFTYLSSTDPGHYVRFRRINDRISYVEHVDMPQGSVTYWGELRIVLGK
jgi:hypothetical protein